MDLDISILDKTIETPVYVKMDAHGPLLLPEGVCKQMGIISYHSEVKPYKSGHTDSPEMSQHEEQSENSPRCQVPIQLESSWLRA